MVAPVIVKATSEGAPSGGTQTTPIIIEGPLSKWTNYAGGYKKRWFVLEGSRLSYFHPSHLQSKANQLASGGSPKKLFKKRTPSLSLMGKSSPRASIQLAAHDRILGHATDFTRFEIVMEHTRLHLRANSVEESRAWQMALQAAIDQLRAKTLPTIILHSPVPRAPAKAARFFSQSTSPNPVVGDGGGRREGGSLDKKVDELDAILDEIVPASAGEQLRRLIGRREAVLKETIADLEKRLDEKGANDPASSSSGEESSSASSSTSGENQFYDAIDQHQQQPIKSLERLGIPGYEAAGPSKVYSPEEAKQMQQVNNGPNPSPPPLPAPSTLMPTVSLWGILKSAIGKDLFRIPVPIQFCEPLSMLQRVCEAMEYAYLLDRAASEQLDPKRRLLLIAAFIVGEYASTAAGGKRVSKPLNPLLGETFEFYRGEGSWAAADGSDSAKSGFEYRYLAEQVSHHPPISAFTCQATRFLLEGEVKVKSKFWGRSLELIPEGLVHLTLHLPDGTRERFGWKRVTTCVRNIVLGRPFLDHYGSTRIESADGQHSCEIEMLSVSEEKNSNSPISEEDVNTRIRIDGKVAAEGNWQGELRIRSTGEVLWRANPRLPEASAYYHWSPFTLALTKDLLGPQSGSSANRALLPPTDSRQRPDTRAMYRGCWNEANRLKALLEANQRQRKHHNHHHQSGYKSTENTVLPRWFSLDDSGSKWMPRWRYLGGYWERRAQVDPQSGAVDWSQGPGIAHELFPTQE